MRFIPSLRQLAATGSIVVAALAVAAAPAQADGSVFGAQLDDLTTGAHGASAKIHPLYIYGENATGGKVVLDLSGVASLVKVDFPDPSSNCSVSGTTATCTAPDGDYDAIVPVRVEPLAGAVDGAEGTIDWKVTSDGTDPFDGTTKITVKSGADLVALDQGHNDVPAHLGDTVSVPVVVGNAGDQAAPGLQFTFSFFHGLKPEFYDDCEYADWPQAHGTFVRCAIPEPLAPGDAVEVEGGFPATVTADASRYERADSTVEVIGDEPPAELNFKKAAGAGKHLKLKPVTARRGLVQEVDPNDNWTNSSWVIDTKSDRSATGAQVHGNVGDTVKVNVGLKNNGPASENSLSSQEPVANFSMYVPGWAKVTAVPSGCQALEKVGDVIYGRGQTPGYKIYTCNLNQYFLGAGQSFTRQFSFKITAATGDAGKVDLTLYGSSVPFKDANNANNTADITLAAAAEPSPGGGDGLPVTGLKVGAIAAGGALVLGIGVAVFFVARRRRLTESH